MKLGVMANAFQKQTTDRAFADSSFKERFGLTVAAYSILTAAITT